MRILIDIGHPAHVHLYKNFSWEMKDKGHEILFTCREKEFEIDLLNAYEFNYVSFGKKYTSLIGKIFGLLYFDYSMFRTAIKFKPDIFLSTGSMYAAQVSSLLRKPHVTMEDTGNMEQVRLYLPFTDVIFSPQELSQDLGDNQIRYNSFHELAYLLPKYFTPDANIYDFLQINKGDKFVVLRFVSWNATHDVGQGGFSSQEKDEIINYLSSRYKLFISSEGILPEKHQKYLIKIPPDKMHHALAFSEFIVSEGATMASEAGVLGTPSIYVNSIKACNNEDLEKDGLVFNFKTGNDVLNKIKEIENISSRKLEFQNRRNYFLDKKIDLTLLLIWFVENYPKSKEIIINNPDYQLRFK